MSRPFLLLLGSALLLALHLGCAQEASSSELQDFSRRNNDFAARLYRALSSRTDDNVYLSPFAVSMGLAAVMAGAGGSTQQQILQSLSLDSLDPQRVPDLYRSLKSSVTLGGAFDISQGIGVLPGQPFSVSSAYLDLVQTKFSGNTQSLAYSDPHQARDTVNAWAQDRTGNQVQDLLSSVDPQTQMLLVIPAFYQCQFALTFNANFTLDERFYVDRYHVVMAPMMFRSDKYHLAYDALLKLGVLKLPMLGGAAMLVLLPDENVDISSVEEEISAERLEGWIRRLKKTKLEVQLPRFLLEQRYALKGALVDLGISEAFGDSADLSGISTVAGLKLTEVLHKARIAVDESSDAPSGGPPAFSSLPPRLTINRPFVFIVYHEQTSSILSMGRVVDPARK